MGAWSWFPVARLLRERGHDVVALTMPGLSYGSSAVDVHLDDAVEFVVDEVERRDLRDVVLVGHSWGGYPITGAAHRVADRLRKVVYVGAVVPAPGTSMADENDAYGRIIHEMIAASPDGTIALPLEALRQSMMQDESPELQELVFAMTLPHPGAYMVESLDVPAVSALGLPTAYVVGADDIALARPAAEFAARVGVEPIAVPGSHMALVTRPPGVATALFDLL